LQVSPFSFTSKNLERKGYFKKMLEEIGGASVWPLLGIPGGFFGIPVGANSSKKGHFIETLEGTYFSTVNDL
jgi:hypothetical protein